jgi:hypothetical protein
LIGYTQVLTGEGKARWLTNRFWSERIRQFHFQLIVNNLPTLVAALQDRSDLRGWLEFRARELDQFKHDYLLGASGDPRCLQGMVRGGGFTTRKSVAITLPARRLSAGTPRSEHRVSSRPGARWCIACCAGFVRRNCGLALAIWMICAARGRFNFRRNVRLFPDRTALRCRCGCVNQCLTHCDSGYD